MNNLARYFTPPTLGDPEKELQAYWLNRYLVAFSSAMLLLMFVVRPFTHYSGFDQIAAIIGLTLLLGVALFCIVLVHFDHVRLAAWIFSISGFIILTILMAIFDGIRSSVTVGYFVIVAAVSLFIRGRATFIFMVLNVVALVVVFVAEQNGFIKTNYNTLATIDDLVILTLALVLNTVLLRQLIEGLNESVATARQSATALLDANKELKASQDSLMALHHQLEERVAERTAELQATNEKLQHEVAERKRTEEAMQQAQKRESLGLMASGIAHDFNNLLVAMLAQTTLAMSQLHANEPVRLHIQKAVMAAEQAAVLIRQMLAYAGGGQLEIEPVNLNQIIETNIHLFRAAIAKNVFLHTELAADLPPIEADRSQLQQVIMNLILNGAEAVEDSTGHLWVKTGKLTLTEGDAHFWHWTGTALPPGEYVCLTVRDSGVGMTPEVRTRIFDPFFTTKEAGQGLGLASVLGIVRDHRGGLHVVSNPGQGTTFRLVFPQGSQAETAVGYSTFARPNNSTRQCVLVIDDESAVREAVTDILGMHEIEVITAENGQAGIDLYSQYRNDVQLVILDMSMPGLNGVETLARLRQIDPDVPVILSSGYSQQQIADEVKVNGHTGFLPKPYDLHTLVSKVWQFLPGTPEP